MAKKINKISISYPPLISDKGTAFLSQNRQFQWTNTGNIIYPVIPAYAATYLKKQGYKVIWDDAIAEKLNYQNWIKRLKQKKPDLVCIETKTPVIKKHWQIINELKKIKGWRPIIALYGDHVTALPEESLQKSKVDYVITGGDYDFMISNLVDHINNKKDLESGFWYKKESEIINSGKFALKHHNLDILPIIDRKLTRWELYAYDNTNYKYKPGAYIMSGRDCWWGKCTFCSWVTLYPGNTFRNFSVDHTFKEIKNLVENFKVKEIFDDSGTLPIGPWLNDLCNRLIKSGINKKIRIGCNMRFAALNQKQYDLMYKAGFRFVLYGLESSNEETLIKIKKNTKVDDAKNTLVLAKKSGLEPHLTVMIGYPWESKKSAVNTLESAKELFKQGLANSLQATIIIPYPGSELYTYCKENNLLLSNDWDDFDMRKPIMLSPISPKDQLILVQNIFKGIITPKFIFNQIISIRNFADIKHLFEYGIKFLKKLKDFSVNDK